MSDPDRRWRANRLLRAPVQVLGFVRKELIETLRQPTLVAILVAGPFAILLAFAGGYDAERTALRTVFVTPEDTNYQQILEPNLEKIDDVVNPQGFTDDVVAARKRLLADEIDLIVVFPPEPAETVLGGERANISILHDKLDPIAQTAVEIAAELAVFELNASILEQLVAGAQEDAAPYDERISTVSQLSGDLVGQVEAGNDEDVRESAARLETGLRGIERVLELSVDVTADLGTQVEPERQESIDAMDAALDDAIRSTQRLQRDDASRAEMSADAEQASAAIARVSENAEAVVDLDPAVGVRPFTSNTENLLREPVSVENFFAPSALSLLLQHLVLTFAALALVRDGQLGLFELYRVGPLGTGRILAGKYLAFGAIGAVIAATSVASVVLGLDTPLRGDPLWLLPGLGLLLAASISLGLVLSAWARTDSQAVQFAMLVLLAGLFFSGFFLDLDTLRQPFRAISWLMPVTFGITILQEVMLRGTSPQTEDLLALGAQTVAYGALAALLLRRRLRTR